MKKPRFPLTVFYDGSCSVCATEMDHYRQRMPAKGLIDFVDISEPDFDPDTYGRSRDDFMEKLHVRDADGRFYLAVDGFWAIWQAFPTLSGFGLLGRLVQFPLIKPLARLGYRTFARLRKYLPKNGGKCEDGSCPLDHPK